MGNFGIWMLKRFHVKKHKIKNYKHGLSAEVNVWI